MGRPKSDIWYAVGLAWYVHVLSECPRHVNSMHGTPFPPTSWLAGQIELCVGVVEITVSALWRVTCTYIPSLPMVGGMVKQIMYIQPWGGRKFNQMST